MTSHNARRFAVEALVIVGSILLAFALDAGWDDRQERERVSELLSAVADDFDREVVALDSVVAVNRRREALQTALLHLTEPGVGTVLADSVARLASEPGNHEIYDPSFGALSALLASGGLERVQDPELRRQLAGWPAELRDLEWEQEHAFNAMDGVITSLRELELMSRVVGLDDFWPARVEATLRSSAHRERESLLNLVYQLYTDDLMRIRRRADDLAAQIRSYLGATP